MPMREPAPQFPGGAEGIRELAEDDLDEVLDIEKLSFAAPWTRGMFRETMASPISKCLGLWIGPSLAGYILLYTAGPEAHILNVAIHPAFRRTGCASRLVSRILSYGQENGVSEYFLEVREGNSAAIQLYSRQGFQFIGKRKNYYVETQEDALVMCKTVL